MQLPLFEAPPGVTTPTRFQHRDCLYKRFLKKLIFNPDLNRPLVSFQENKMEPFVRWFKFKEGFSVRLVRNLPQHFASTSTKPLRILDPFAGTGTTVTTAIQEGHYGLGVELLPIGIATMKARAIGDRVKLESFVYYLKLLKNLDWENVRNDQFRFPHLPITEKAFSPATEKNLASFLGIINTIDDADVKFLFWFAALTILEDISYTSKDGQYLRWDARSGRKLRSNYRKSKIWNFQSAIFQKLTAMLEDLRKRNGGSYADRMRIIEASCLEELPKLETHSIDLIITSPPYCNRYDYTRTYTLDLAFLGFNEDKVKNLRQELLSSTVENNPQKSTLRQIYSDLGRTSFWQQANEAFEGQSALHEILLFLKTAQRDGKLNNNNIPVMVENYFLELNLVIHELARILKPQGRIYMVNDNVQYLGEEIPVDLILSDFAEHAGLKFDAIWILPRGKGNSSQQMGRFGRNEIRKCIYVSSKPA